MNADPHPTRFLLPLVRGDPGRSLGHAAPSCNHCSADTALRTIFHGTGGPHPGTELPELSPPRQRQGRSFSCYQGGFDEAGLVGGTLGLSEGDSVIRWKSSGDAQERPTALIAGATNAHRMGKPRAPWPQEHVLLPSPDQGQQGWAFQPLFEGEPPASAMADHPIDRFVIHSLEKKGLSLSPPADRGTLVRRLLLRPHRATAQFGRNSRIYARSGPTGLRKTGRSSTALPAYGERWGRHWLDVIRFGESRGFERNEIILNAWPFQDYVIDSFNADKPLDQLILEHLAGDQLAPNDPSVSVGTTFLVCGPYDDVGNQDPAQAAQIRANTIDEIIRATSEAFLGLTVGCSRCHDHKFDPISQEDYYRWYATFRGFATVPGK